jgi:hypothetical protein
MSSFVIERLADSLTLANAVPSPTGWILMPPTAVLSGTLRDLYPIAPVMNVSGANGQGGTGRRSLQVGKTPHLRRFVAYGKRIAL